VGIRDNTELLGLYEGPDQAADAVGNLKEAGFEDNAIEVLSATPYPEGAFGEQTIKHRLFTFPFAGAACGLAIGLAWVIGAQVSLPIVTGGKPIVAFPAIIQILYEGTMLGAVLFTIIGVLFESRLPDGIGLYDERIADGYIGISVMTETERMQEARTVLNGAGAIDIISAEKSSPAAAPATSNA
jgi:hypothetical protein